MDVDPCIIKLIGILVQHMGRGWEGPDGATSYLESSYVFAAIEESFDLYPHVLVTLVEDAVGELRRIEQNDAPTVRHPHPQACGTVDRVNRGL